MNKIRDIVASVDIGFVNTGIAYAARVGEHVAIAGVVINTEGAFTPTQRKALHVSDQLVERVIGLLRSLEDEWDTSQNIRGVLIEMPTGGSKSGAAARGMGISIAISALIKMTLRCPVEIYTPPKVRKKVIGRQAMPRRLTTTKGGKMRMESQTKQAVRASVLKRFEFDEASMAAIPRGKREHVYDAAAVLVAARDESLIRSLGWPRAIFEEGSYAPTTAAGNG